MNLKDLIRDNFNKFNTLPTVIILIIFIVFGIAYFITHNILEGIIYLLLLIFFPIIVYAFYYISGIIYNHFALGVLEKNGILDEINQEIEHLDKRDFDKAKRKRFLNTENYSIVFDHFLRIYKFEDITGMFKAPMRYHSSYRVIVKLKNGKKYNAIHNFGNYYEETLEILHSKGIEIKNGTSMLYSFMIRFKPIIVIMIILLIITIIIYEKIKYNIMLF